MPIMHSPMLKASLAALVAGLALIEAAPQDSPRTFPTPQAAAQALVEAAAQNDTAALLKVLGPGGKDIVQSGDAADDKAARTEFAAHARARLQVKSDRDNPNRAMLVFGDQNWPFPVPLIRQDGGWYFDTATGRVEILARRIGRNELAAIDICRAYVEAQMEYALRVHNSHGLLTYAQQIVSSPGKQDGLYDGAESANLAPKSFADAAVLQQGMTPAPYHGYFYHF